ncbi:MAG TPA: pilus assembly protein PilZ [Desulfobacteraceae bacterium]|nr:pilus assembly protein PilZ [Desulfobacteraceae bacterium]
METNRPHKIISIKVGPIKHASSEKPRLPPWLFEHQELTDALENAKQIDQETLVRRINHINFMNGHVFVLLGHPRYKESILAKAYPEACLGKELTCRWSDENFFCLKLENYQFQYLIIANGEPIVLVPGKLQTINSEFVTIYLPQQAYAVAQRQVMRQASQGIVVELTQSGFVARGELIDFSPNGFRIRARPEPPASFHWFNSDMPVSTNLRCDGRVVFSGRCKCVRQQDNFHDRELVLVPVDKKITRFKRKGHRNPRQHLIPSPTLFFNHPFIKKRIKLEVSNISTSGFCVYEEADEGVLMPGMIIPELIIIFAGGLRMECSAQIIYCLQENEKGVRCGIVILDMDINTYSHLIDMLINAMEPHAHVSGEVDMDALWEFFFDTGFIYPKKYKLIQSHREDFKKTYRKLYQESPEIARHFTYEKNGRIYGHLSMVRAYESTWLIQHHASRPIENKRAGFVVLKHIILYLNDVRRLPSAKTDYLMSYFRPENKFPDRVFGGFAKYLKNAKGCSMDLFSFLSFPNLSKDTKLPEGWLLREYSALDLWELSRFYNHYSGGLLLDALHLGQEDSGDESLEEAYGRFGFLRKRKVYSLTHDGELNTVLIVNQSDLGFNLSELLNCIKVLVTTPQGPPWNVLSIALAQLTDIYHKLMDRVPVLIYPCNYVETESVPYEKQYQTWIMNAPKYGDEFMEYIQKKFRIKYE